MKLFACFISLIFCLGLHAQQTTTGAPLATSVSDFGAVCDGSTNDSPAINAALSSLGAAGGMVYLPQGTVCAINSTISIPASYTTLDCNGSTLLYMTATGDAVHVLPFASDVPYISGGMRDCWVKEGTGASTSSIGIHQESRLGFTYKNLRISGFNGATSVCMEWENTSNGPQFTEQTSIAVADTFDCSKHLRLLNSSGTNSFAYNYISGWHCTDNPGQICLALDGNGTSNNILMFGGTLDMRVNANGSTAMWAIKATGGSVVERKSANLNGELTSGTGPLYSLYSDANSSINVTGDVEVTGAVTFSGASQTITAVTLPTDPTLGAAFWQPGGGILPQRHCKYTLGYPSLISGNGGDAIFWLANYGGTENNCFFQIVKRATDNTNQDVNVTGSGNAPVNILYADALDGNVGFGPGFTVGGFHPQFSVDALGGTMRTSNVLTMGNSLGMHRNYAGTNSDESFTILINSGQTTNTFTFTTAFASLPTCVATPNTTLIQSGANPHIGTWAIAETVSNMTLTQQFLITTTGALTTASFPVTYFVHCTANGS